MSIFNQENLLRKVKQDSAIGVIKSLIDMDNYELKTELPVSRPVLAMSLADVWGVYLSNPKSIRDTLNLPEDSPILLGDLVSLILRRARINMFNEGRESRHEVMQAVQGVHETDKETSFLKRALLG